jgi:diaminopimelate epimerase (EC 5.1.1.7)
MEHNFFVKAHGLGNEYITLDQENISFELTKERIVRMCNIHFGIGSDGILLKVPGTKADFGLRILNPDGSEAEKSGNGLRIFAKYLYDWGFTDKEKFTIETPGGIVTAHIIEKRNGKAFRIKVDMGKAIFKSEQVPVNYPKEECFGEVLRIEDKEFMVHCISVGNPHCVILKEELDEAETRHYGPIIENHPMFPNRINVQFVKVLSRNEVEILIWERGAGYTLASGSSSSAVATAMYRKGLTDGQVTVKMPGGELMLEIDPDFEIRMTGEVRETAYGKLSDELLNY